MKLDARLRNGLAFAAADARDAEEAGYDGAWSSENESDAFLPLALAAGATARIELGPSVAIAFSRTPMTVAYQAADLQRFSDGRFVLGLGSQIRPHIEKRFSMPWSRPAARMREFVLALRAIFRCWEEGEPLRFEGEFYRHTLMTPHFSPPPVPGGPPPIYLAAVGPLMTEVAGEVADGLLAHPFLTVDYLRDVVLPAVERGRAKAGRTLDGFEIGLSAFVALDDADVEAVRRQISFYGSTPAYRPVLDNHGWGELQTELNSLSKQGRWDDMVRLVDDDVLAAMCAIGSPAEVAAQLVERYGGLAQRIRFNRPGDVPPPGRFAELVDAVRAATR
ncbi:MAG: TIGR03617 family F420-dependent LLM class oxidoreductase [Acidimicrobiia bacterium]